MPVWLVALVLAGAAPLVVRLLGDRLARQLGDRTDKIVAELGRVARKRHAAAPREDAS